MLQDLYKEFYNWMGQPYHFQISILVLAWLSGFCFGALFQAIVRHKLRRSIKEVWLAIYPDRVEDIISKCR